MKCRGCLVPFFGASVPEVHPSFCSHSCHRAFMTGLAAGRSERAAQVELLEATVAELHDRLIGMTAEDVAC